MTAKIFLTSKISSTAIEYTVEHKTVESLRWWTDFLTHHSYLKYIYDDIVQNEIKMSDNPAEVDTAKDKTGLDVILTALNPRMVRKREQEELEQLALKKAEALYSRTSKGASGTMYRWMALSRFFFKKKQHTDIERPLFFGTAFRSANEAGMEIAGPMMNTAWPCLFAAFSKVLGTTEDMELVHLCLRGFQASIHVLCITGMDKERDIFISSLSKFTVLLSVDEMRQKNVEAVRTLINIAIENGNQLQESWAQVGCRICSNIHVCGTISEWGIVVWYRYSNAYRDTSIYIC